MNKQKTHILLKKLAVESRIDLLKKVDSCECGEDESVCMTDLSKELKMPLPNVQRNIRELENIGLIEVNKVSRTCYCNVTKLGKKVIYLLQELENV